MYKHRSNVKKSDYSGFYSDYKRIIAISGIAAASGAFLTFTSIFLFPLTDSAKFNILLTALGVFLFIFLWHLTPKICLNKKIAFIPDLVYIIAISIIMSNAGEYSYIYFGFYMILAAVDAFMFPLLQYSIVIFGMFVGVALAAPPGVSIFSRDQLYQYYGILTIATVLHLIARDALALKRKKDSLEEDIARIEKSKEEIMNMLESLNEGMIVVNQSDKITFFNSSVVKLLGVKGPSESILDKNINTYMPTVGPDGPESVTQQSHKTKKQVIRSDFKIINKNKTMRLHTNVTPVITELGDWGGAIIFFRDITKQKLLEEQEAEFNAVTSHELRTPLTIIEGYLSFLLDPASGLRYDSGSKEFIEKAYRASLNLNRLVTDILTITRLDSGSVLLNIKKFNLKEFIKKEVKKLEEQKENPNVSLSVRFLESSKISSVETDRVKLKEILDNLVVNSFKFTNKGEVEVVVERINKDIKVTVKDTGIGIAEEDMDRIFDKYYRSERWENKQTSGTGIGLYIVKKLTEMIGGRVGVESTLNKGSKFYFTFPIENKGQHTAKESNELDKFMTTT